MPSSSEKQRRYIYYLRGKYKTKKDAPEKYKWVWNDEWLKVEESYKDDKYWLTNTGELLVVPKGKYHHNVVKDYHSCLADGWIRILIANEMVHCNCCGYDNHKFKRIYTFVTKHPEYKKLPVMVTDAKTKDMKVYGEGMKENVLKKYKRLEEEIVLPINKNDTIFYGKFKNKKGVVADIIKNEKGDYFVVLDTGKQIPLLKVRLGLGEEVHKFSESLRFSDLMKMASLSPFTRDYNKETNKLMGNPTNHTKLKSAKFNIKKDYVTFKWVTKRTPKYPKGYKMKAYDPITKSLVPARQYTIEIRVLNFFKLLNTSPTDITNKDIEDVLKVADIQIFSSVPMFQFQGANFNMTMFDASIYPENRPPKYWNKVVSKYGKTHDEKQFLDKHTAGVINSIPYYRNLMRQVVKSFMIKKGMLKSTSQSPFPKGKGLNREV